MTDPIRTAAQLDDTSTFRRIRRRRDALPDLATCAALLVLAAAIVLASLQSLTAGLATTLLAALACLGLWALTTERGSAAWRGLLPPLVDAWHWLCRASGQHGRHRRHGWGRPTRRSRHRAVHSR